MRVPPPGSLKLDRRALLRDVRDRLAERLPKFASGETDLTDPGWMLLEQSAWMAEILSGRLDQYPFAVVQHFVRMMGGQLRPAQPAVGVVVVEPSVPGVLKQDPGKPGPCRFFTTQTEASDLIEFVPIDVEVPVRKGWVDSICRIDGGELVLEHHLGDLDGVDAQVGWQTQGQRSGIFDAEQIQFVLATANSKKLVASLEKVIAKMDERKVGWLRLSIDAETKGQVVVTATIDPASAFAEAAPDGLWSGGDLQGHWGSLDDTNWTPPVLIADHPLLPVRVRGSRPMPGSEENTILLPDVPSGIPVDQLLLRAASPMPDTVTEALWKTLAHQDKSLVPFKPVIRRSYEGSGTTDGDPAWVMQALDSGVWNQLAAESHTTVAHIRLHPKSQQAGKVRVGLVLEDASADFASTITIFGEHAEGHVPAEPLEHEVIWRTLVPPPGSRHGMGMVVAVDIVVEKSHSGVIVATGEDTLGVLVNPLLVANMPAVRDGREIRVRRNVPEGVSLLFQDLVTPSVIDQLAEEPIPADTLALVKQFALSHFALKDGDDIDDWRGLDVDPSAGNMTINAPDRDGNMQTIPTGERLKLTWYRRTDGARGNVPAGSIRLVEQEASAKPGLSKVRNPVGSFFGAGRETPEAAADRLFAPAGGTPVLPADFERMVRQALGTRGHGWLVRCWSFAERSLVSSALWPLDEPKKKGDPETIALAKALADAGPDSLLVAVGPRDEVLADEDLDWARKTVQRRIQVLGERLPVIRKAIVTRLWPLTLKTEVDPDGLRLPSYDLARCKGELADPKGRSAAPPRAAMFLNAAVVGIDLVEEEE